MKPEPTPSPVPSRLQDALRELTICAMASSIADAGEQCAFLEESCGDDNEMRLRIEQRLAERMTAALAAPAAQPALKLRSSEQGAAPALSRPAPKSPMGLGVAPAEPAKDSGGLGRGLPAAFPTANHGFARENPAAAALARPQAPKTPEPARAAAPSAPTPAPTPVAAIEPVEAPAPKIVSLPAPLPAPAAVSVVPPVAAPKSSPAVAWVAALLSTAALGALAITLIQEKNARQQAESAMVKGRAAEEQARLERDQALARSVEATTAIEEARRLRVESERLREQAEINARQAVTAEAEAKAEADKLRADSEMHKSQAVTTVTQAQSALSTAEQERLRSRAVQKQTAALLADTLARLAANQLENSRTTDAENTARQCLEVLTSQEIDGWPVLEARSLLGSALLQRNKDADAEIEFLAVTTGLEEVGSPEADVDPARWSAAVKRVVHFYTSTGQRKVANEVKHKFELLRTTPQGSAPARPAQNPQNTPQNTQNAPR